MTLKDYAGPWLERGPEGVHPRTGRCYARNFRLYVLPALGDRPLVALERNEIRSLLVGLIQRGKGKSIVRNSQIALASCLTSALDEGLIPANPARGTLRRLIRHRPEAGLDRSLARGEIGRFLAASRLIAFEMDDLFWTLAYSGCRIAEGLGLQPGDLEADRGKLRIARQWIEGDEDLPKGGRQRTIDIPSILVERLASRIAALPGHRWVFQGRDGVPWHPSSVRNRMRAVLQAANLSPRVTPHWFRHSLACRLLEESGDMAYTKAQLGHQSVSTTIDLYGQGARPDRRDAVERLVDGPRHGPLPMPPRSPAASAGELPPQRPESERKK